MIFKLLDSNINQIIKFTKKTKKLTNNYLDYK